MAQRDEVARALRGHDAGDARGGEHVALLGAAAHDERLGLGAHLDERAGDRAAVGDVLVGDVDHVRVAVLVEVRELVGTC